jgi:hypothetical protein
MDLVKKYNERCPEANLDKIIDEIESHAFLKGKYWRSPDEIYLSAHMYTMLEELFQNPEIEKELAQHMIAMYDYINVDHPEYSFFDTGEILPES